MAGEPAEKLMLFNGKTKDGLVAIGPLKDSASRARSSAAAPKGALVTSHPDFKRYVKTQYTIALNKNGGGTKMRGKLSETASGLAFVFFLRLRAP